MGIVITKRRVFVISIFSIIFLSTLAFQSSNFSLVQNAQAAIHEPPLAPIPGNYTGYVGVIAVVTTTEGSLICKTTGFEGAGQNPVGTINGVTFSANTLGLVDSDAGGGGNFANEPSPDTIIFWSDGSASISATFSPPVSKVNFFYTGGDFIPGFPTPGAGVITLKAFDSSNNLLQTVTSPTTPVNNGLGDPNGQFDIFAQITLTETTNDISKVEILGDNGATGVDDFKYCQITNTAPTANADNTPTTNEDNSVPITLTGSDADGDALTFSIATNPSDGSLGAIGSVTCDGATPNNCEADVTYTPDGDFNGADSFTFKVNDGTVDSAAATVDVTVNAVNDPPTINGIGPQQLN